MSDPKEEEVAKPAPVAKKSGKLYLILGALLLVIVSAGIPTTIFFVLSKKSHAELEHLPEDAASEHGSVNEAKAALLEEELEEGEELLGPITPLDTFVVNLSGGKYIRLQLQVEFVGHDIPRRYYSKTVPIRDSVISVLAKKSADDLLTSKGRDTLKQEVLEVINETLKRQDVKRVYFTQFVVQ